MSSSLSRDSSTVSPTARPGPAGVVIDRAVFENEVNSEGAIDPNVPAACVIHGDGCDGFSEEHHHRILMALERDIEQLETMQTTTATDTADTATTTATTTTEQPTTTATEPAIAITTTTTTADERSPRRARHAEDLGRQVRFVQNAHRIVQTTMRVHRANVSGEMARLNQQVDLYSVAVEKKEATPRREVKEAVSHRLSAWLQYMQHRFIEPRVGRFSHNDNLFVHGLSRLEDRLLALLWIGLMRQEMVSRLAERGGERWLRGKEGKDYSGSCTLEARSWQMDILRKWIAQVVARTDALNTVE